MDDFVEKFECYNPKTLLFSDMMCEVLGKPVEELKEFLDMITWRNVSKNDFVIRPGDMVKHTYYVEKGVLRMYVIDKVGKEHVVQFAPEGWFVTDRQCTYLNEPSEYFIQAIEDTQMALVPKDFLRRIMAVYPKIIEKNTFFLNRYIMLYQRRITLLLSATAEERYLAFMQTHPNFINRVPLYMLASYLGITPESLSRVRNELAKK